jgi:hypothetical protein
MSPTRLGLRHARCLHGRPRLHGTHLRHQAGVEHPFQTDGIRNDISQAANAEAKPFGKEHEGLKQVRCETDCGVSASSCVRHWHIQREDRCEFLLNALWLQRSERMLDRQKWLQGIN